MPPSDSHDRVISLFGIGDHVSATTTRNGKIVGFGESHGRGRAASGDMDDSGHVSITVAGKSPRGEEGSLQACHRLVDHLNSIGQSWRSPEVSGVQYVDAIASGEGDFSGHNLTIQVVRAFTDPAFWQHLGHTGNNAVSASLSESALLLKLAVQLKVEKIPLEHRSHLTLALDACDVPGLALDAVIEEFNLQHGDWVESHGFHSVWVVGPWREMVNQLCRAKS